MADPVLHLLVGSNGAGKTTLHELIIGPVTGLPFVNADLIAAERWPDDPIGRSYDAAIVAAERRAAWIDERRSFVAETVFSHESKLGLVRSAVDAGYLVTLHVVVIPEGLAVARVANRVSVGGHAVPEHKVRERYQRIWPLVAEAIRLVDVAHVYDNSRTVHPFSPIARFERGVLVGTPEWPAWTPSPLSVVGT